MIVTVVVGHLVNALRVDRAWRKVQVTVLEHGGSCH